MKASVDESACIGCGLCVEGCPSVFQMDGEVAKAMTGPVPAGDESTCRDMAEACPVSAINVD